MYLPLLGPPSTPGRLSLEPATGSLRYAEGEPRPLLSVRPLEVSP